MEFSKLLKSHQAMVIVKSGKPKQHKRTSQDPGMTIHYKGFIIEPQLVDVCTELEGNEFIVKGQRAAYKICHSATKLIYGIKSTLAAARNTIDKNELRWLSVKP